MKLLQTPVVLLFLLLLILLHIVSLVARGKTAKIINFVNIFLHIALFIPMLNSRFSIEEAVLVYMISIFFYTLFAVIGYRRQCRYEKRIEAMRERFLAARAKAPSKEEGNV